jgi:S-adenosylmethionine-dependent methyltransferase
VAAEERAAAGLGRIRGLARRWLPGGAARLPAHLERNLRTLDPATEAQLRRSLIEHYFAGSPSGYLDTEIGRRDLDAHLFHRLARHRRVIVPWLDHARPLRGARILEIGCGTGSSTVALAEQGADVTGVDIDEPALAVARDRVRLHAERATLVSCNATRVAERFAGERFDFIIYFAALEHMTHPERLESIAGTWAMLSSGGLFVVIETPNRLWYFDGHTALLPFFHWLPEDLAFEYTRFSQRTNFREIYREDTPERRQHFLRRGRGVSFHEFELAIGPAAQLEVVSSLHEFAGRRRLLPWPRRAPMARSYSRILARVGPAGVHEGFYQQDLDLILRK